MAISNTVLTTLPTAVYTSTGSTVVNLMYLCNTAGTARTINLYAVPSGGTPTTSTQIYSNYLIGPSDTLVINSEKIILNNGDAIYASANVSASITSTIGYISL
jgi:hypothetical protein